MDREIKVTKCGEQKVCGVNDRISIEFNPFEVLNITRIFGKHALASTNPRDQHNELALHDVFCMAREMWTKMRKERAGMYTLKEDLLEFERDASVLPLLTGKPNAPPLEIITCTSISEEPDFAKGMPTRLTLVRKFANGESHTAFYRKMVKKSREKDK